VPILRDVRAALTDPAAELRDWWKDLVAKEPPPPDTRGIWFGLIEVGRGDTISGVRGYVYGLKRFDAADPPCRWFTEAFWIGEDRQGPYWFPNGRYIQPSSWRTTAAYDWADALKRASAALTALRPWDDCPAVEVVGVGFDDGDGYLIPCRRENACRALAEPASAPPALDARCPRPGRADPGLHVIRRDGIARA